jgi:multidrug efflux pump subunit AcrA (membrane-fusion protein)
MCLDKVAAEHGLVTTDAELERAVEEAEQELEVVRAGAEEVVQARLGERNEVESKLDICKNDTAMILVNGRETKSVATNTLKMCLDKVAAQHGLVTTDAELERAIEEAEQEMEIVKAGAEEVLAERDIQQACSHEFQIAISPGGKLYPSTRNIEVLEEYFSECIPRMELELASEGGTDVEKAAEAVEQEMEIVKAGAEQVVEEKAMVEDLQNKCLSEFNSAKNRYGIGGTPRLNINQFMTECMNEGSKDLAVLGDIDVDVEKAIEEAEQEMEIVKAGAEDVFEERVASLEEKVAELTKLLEALQTQ